MKNIKKFAIIFLVAGCNKSFSEPDVHPRESVEKIRLPLIDGIKPSVDGTKFSAGAFINYEPKGFDGERFLFESGVFVIRPNGHQMLILNADAPNRLTDPVNDPNVANEMIRSYLENRGAPKEQLGGAHVTTLKSGLSKNEGESSEEFAGYISNIERKIDNVPVADSIAWAKFRQDGTTVAESIYWPNIPTSILVDVAEFKKNLSESTYLKDAIASYPKASGLVIHHTPLSQMGELRTIVTYDVLSKETTRPRIINLNKNGEEIKLPWYENFETYSDTKAEK